MHPLSEIAKNRVTLWETLKAMGENGITVPMKGLPIGIPYYIKGFEHEGMYVSVDEAESECISLQSGRTVNYTRIGFDDKYSVIVIHPKFWNENVLRFASDVYKDTRPRDPFEGNELAERIRAYEKHNSTAKFRERFADVLRVPPNRTRADLPDMKLGTVVLIPAIATNVLLLRRDDRKDSTGLILDTGHIHTEFYSNFIGYYMDPKSISF